MREIEREDEFSSAKSKRTNAYIIMHSRKNAHTFPRVRAFSLRGVPTRTQRSLVSGGVARVASRRSRRRSVFLFLFAVLRFFYLFLLLASLSLSFCPPIPRPRKKKEIIVLERRRTPRDRRIARVPRDSSAPNTYHRARTNNKNRRRTQTTQTTTTHSFFFSLRLCVGEFVR